MEREVFKASGAIAAIWMIAGVAFIARSLPGYSHSQQVLSELGAKGRATARIHPLVNNFPLAFFYLVFGIAVGLSFRGDGLAVTSGILIVVHGLCHAITGVYPCDEDLGMVMPSATQVVHNLAGALMLASLFGACAIWSLGFSQVFGGWFQWYSGISCILSAGFAVLMGKAFYSGYRLGLYQRLSYGVLVLWAAVFSLLAYVHA